MKRYSASWMPLLATACLAGSILPANPASASAKGRKNTAIGLGAAAAQQLLTGKTTNGLLLGAGTAYAYKRYKDAQSDEARQRRASAYDSYDSETYDTDTYRSDRAYGGSSPRIVSTTTTRRVSRYGGASPSSAKITYGTYVFTGPLADAAGPSDRFITVDHNGILRRAEVPPSAIVTHAGSRLSVYDLRPGDIVRVTAVQTRPNRWRAARVEMLDNYAVDNRVGSTTRTEYQERTTRRARLGGADISDVEITDSVPVLAPYTGVGIVTRVERDGTNFDVRVGSNTRTVYVIDTRFQGVSDARSLRKGDRVRVIGDVEGRDVLADRVIMLD